MARSTQARVAVLAAAGAIVGIVPLPILPSRMLRAIRGALAHDVCARHGLALTADARDVLSEPIHLGEKPSLTRDAIVYAASRALARVVPYTGFVAPARSAYETLAFGRLLDRYLERHRSNGRQGHVVRIDEQEARAIRRLLDRAALRVLRPGLPDDDEPRTEAPEDYRGVVQRTIDTVLLGAASLPEALGHRLDAALDDVVTQEA